MKYFTAFVSGLFMFFAVWFLLGLLFLAVMPRAWAGVELGIVEGGIPSLLAAILAGLGATYTFKASLHAKTGRLYKNKKANKDDMIVEGNPQKNGSLETSGA